MQNQSFVHLHNHTQFSLLDGAIRLGPMIKKAVEFNMPAIAMTDHGNMFGSIQFFNLAKKNNIKPIIGCEVYVAPQSRFDKKSAGGISDASYHLTLIARNNEGYKNLTQLVTSGFLEGFYYRPRIDMDILSKHSKGLIALSGCWKGEVATMLRRENYDAAQKVASDYKDILEKDCFYIELHDQSMEGQTSLNNKLVKLGKDLEIPVVAANDCHYLEQKDSAAHDALLCIQTGKTLSDTNRMKLSTDQFYLKSPQEMIALFKDVPDAITNTLKIADMCDVTFEFDKLHLPHYDVPEGKTLDDYLRDLSEEGLEKRLKIVDEKDKEVYLSRFNEELKIIKQMGYAGYFLIVWDFIDYARKNNVPVGPGRGSAAGSLVAYCLWITNIDPLKYNLIFERFLNPERVTMPDIDVDFCMEKRDKVIEYVTKKYGKSNVSQIITFGSMLAKGVLRDVGRVMDIPYGEVDKIAKLVPNKLNITLQEAIDEEPKFNELKKNDRIVSKLLETSLTLEGLTRHASVHAAGVVITPLPLTEYVPLYKSPTSEYAVTQFPMGDIEKLGLLKMDFLGLKTLTVINNAVKLIKEVKGTDLDVDNLNMADKDTYTLLGSGKCLGIFQLESSGMRDLLRKFKPQTFEDIIATIALYRPGPLNSGMVDDFIERKHGKVAVTYELPQLEDVLKETYGVIVYQEQVMKIASALAGFSMGEADLLRRAMGKKKHDVMAEQKKKFLAGAEKNKLDMKKSEKIFDLMALFAEYGFNKSHSAAYALITYQTAYLKTHYPREFMASLLTCDMGNTDKVIRYTNECREMGLKVFPPDINASFVDFTPSEEGIRFGLAAIKSVGKNAVYDIIRARKKCKKFASLVSFLEDVDLRIVNRKVVENLIKCGACDSTSMKRAQMLYDLDKMIEFAQKSQKDRDSGQISLFGSLTSGKGSMPIGFTASSVDDLTEKVSLSYEKEALGFYITGHPLMPYEDFLKRFTNINSQNVTKASSRAVCMGGIVSSLSVKRTRRGEKMAFMNLEDLHGSIEVIIFPDTFREVEELLNGDDPIYVKGDLETKDSEAKIIAKEIMPLDNLKDKFKGNVHINISAAMNGKETLLELKDILHTHKGANPVFLHFMFLDEKKICIETSKSFSVTASDLLVSKVEKLVGDQVVYFE